MPATDPVVAPLRARVTALEVENARLRAALERLVTWCRRPEFGAHGALAHAHGFRPSDEMVAESIAVWAVVEAALDPEAT